MLTASPLPANARRPRTSIRIRITLSSFKQRNPVDCAVRVRPASRSALVSQRGRGDPRPTLDRQPPGAIEISVGLVYVVYCVKIELFSLCHACYQTRCRSWLQIRLSSFWDLVLNSVHCSVSCSIHTNLLTARRKCCILRSSIGAAASYPQVVVREAITSSHVV
jgi:hypothetical protein